MVFVMHINATTISQRMSPAYQGSTAFSPAEERMKHHLITTGRTHWISLYQHSNNDYEFFSREGCLCAIDEIAAMTSMDQLEERISDLRTKLLRQEADDLHVYLKRLSRYHEERATAHDAETLATYGMFALMTSTYTLINATRTVEATIPSLSSPSRTRTPLWRRSHRNRQR